MFSICSERLVAAIISSALRLLGSRAPPPVRYGLNSTKRFAAMHLKKKKKNAVSLQALKGQQVSLARGIICPIFSQRYSSKPGQGTSSDLVH